MKRFTMLFVVTLLIVVTGCATQKPASDIDRVAATAKEGGFLGDYSDLTPGKDATEAMLRWRDPNVAVGSYDKVMVEPVQIWGDAEKDTENQQDLIALANYAHNALVKALGTRYEVVDRPGPDTAILRFAITNAAASSSTMKAISTVVPIGMVASAATEAVTDKPAFAGEIQVEFIFMDSKTGKIFAKGVDKRVGGRSLRTITDSWSTARAALDAYASIAVYRICLMRKDENCPVPEN